ncbi:MAG: transposase [Anaerolineales bacterium]
MFFRVSAAATQKLAQDPRFIGGQVGMVGVLHTWGRTLTYHPHVHYLVPAGGVDQDGNWLPARKSFLLLVKALSKIFRAKFRNALRKSPCCQEIPAQIWQQPWVVHYKAVGDGVSALIYLAPYIFRVAISNKHIVKLSSTQVTFRYRSTKTGKTKTCILSAEEFIRRFLQHVLPKGFVKIRYYGFLCPGLRSRLTNLRSQLDELQPNQTAGDRDSQSITLPTDCLLCLACGQVMQKVKVIPVYVHKPP